MDAWQIGILPKIIYNLMIGMAKPDRRENLRFQFWIFIKIKKAPDKYCACPRLHFILSNALIGLT